MTGARGATSTVLGGLGRVLALVIVAGVALQVWFVLRIALMAVVDPQSTTFQRSEAWRLATSSGRLTWHQAWRDGERISANLHRAVIASEDAGFVQHGGVDWEAIERAWERNQRERQRAARQAERAPDVEVRTRIVGGSTISQQLAKNLFLSGERTLLRKGQELVLTLMLERLLDKRRILEIYLNSVEWGEGVFGAEAAARRHFNTSADRLSESQAARLAVILPRPKYFERRPDSAFVADRAGTIRARMAQVAVP